MNFAQRVQQIAADQNERVDIYAISCHPNRRLCRQQTSTRYPIVRLFKRRDIEGIDMLYTDIHPLKALHKMGMQVEAAEFVDDWDVPAPQINLYPTWQRILDDMLGNEREVRPYHHRTREELKADIHLSLDFALRDGLFTSDNPISPGAADALKAWLQLLHKTLPEAWEVHVLIDELLRDFNYISKHEGYLTRVLDQHPPENASWSEACSKGDPDAGYTCGLWEMFHAMTVGVVNYNMMIPEHRRISTEDAAMTLRNYVENFFGCIECRNNFLETFDSCAFNRCTRLEKDPLGVAQIKQKAWAELPLWLFEVHNDVNIRLVQEKAKRENRIASKDEEDAALWPMKEECLPCYNTDLKKSDATWDSKNLYNWLQLEYGQLDSSSGAIRKEIHDITVETQRKLKKKKRRVKMSFGSIIGMLCFVTYSCGKVRRRMVTGRHKKDAGN
jgi:Erv1 / Alr family